MNREIINRSCLLAVLSKAGRSMSVVSAYLMGLIRGSLLYRVAAGISRGMSKTVFNEEVNALSAVLKTSISFRFINKVVFKLSRDFSVFFDSSRVLGFLRSIMGKPRIYMLKAVSIAFFSAVLVNLVLFCFSGNPRFLCRDIFWIVASTMSLLGMISGLALRDFRSGSLLLKIFHGKD